MNAQAFALVERMVARHARQRETATFWTENAAIAEKLGRLVDALRWRRWARGSAQCSVKLRRRIVKLSRGVQ